jgi:hypothetical protein
MWSRSNLTFEVTRLAKILLRKKRLSKKTLPMRISPNLSVRNQS